MGSNHSRAGERWRTTLADRVLRSGIAIVGGRARVVTARRRLLARGLRQAVSTGDPRLRAKTTGLRDAARKANTAYIDALVNWGSRSTNQYRVDGREQLLAYVESLEPELLASLQSLPPDDRFEAATQVQMLEELIDDGSQDPHSPRVDLN